MIANAWSTTQAPSNILSWVGWEVVFSLFRGCWGLFRGVGSFRGCWGLFRVCWGLFRVCWGLFRGVGVFLGVLGSF